jgi:hypothetical protein
LIAAADGGPSVRPGDLDPQTLSDHLKRADDAETWIRAVRQYAHEYLEEGQAIPDWKLVAKRAARQWVDVDAAIVHLVDAGAEKDALYKAPEPLTVAQMEKAVGKALFAEACADDVQSVSSGTTLVPESDKRKAVTPAGGLRKLAEQTKARALTGK